VPTAGIGGQGFHIPALTLCVKRIESKGGFTRSRNAGDNGERVPGNVNIDILEVVFASALYEDGVCGHKDNSKFQIPDSRFQIDPRSNIQDPRNQFLLRLHIE
jgi:hypothetical protein